VVVFLALTACVGQDTAQIELASESAERQIRPGMSVADVVDIAAAQDRRFSVSGSCGPEGALTVGGDGKDVSLWAARGSPSGGDGSPEFSFATRLDLRQALSGKLLNDGPCSRLFVGFSGWRSWRFQVDLDGDGRVVAVKPTEAWQ